MKIMMITIGENEILMLVIIYHLQSRYDNNSNNSNSNKYKKTI